MEYENDNIIPQDEQDAGYAPRPKWQVWLARIVLVLFLCLVAMYYINIARGGR